MSIERVFVAGAGLMGHGIAPGPRRDRQARRRCTSRTSRAPRPAGTRIARQPRARRREGQARRRPSATRSSARLLASDDLDLAADRRPRRRGRVRGPRRSSAALWPTLDGIAPGRGAIFASNTSSISIDALAAAVSAARRARFVGMHFFSPVPVMPLIELIRGQRDRPMPPRRRSATLAGELGKQVIVSADRPGFIVNRILMPFLARGDARVRGGHSGRRRTSTRGRGSGSNHPMGPLELADFIGLDVCLGIMSVLARGLRAARSSRRRRCWVELVAAGHLGQKTGRGFHTYPR